VNERCYVEAKLSKIDSKLKVRLFTGLVKREETLCVCVCVCV